MQTLLLSIFAAAALLQLYACFYGKQRLRAITKPLLMPLLAVLYFISADEPRLLVAATLLCGMAGDIFLLLPNKFFKYGMIFFGLGHIGYIAAFFLYAGAGGAPFFPAVLLAALYMGAAASFHGRIFSYIPKERKAETFFYTLLLCAMGVAAGMSFFVRSTPSRLPFLLGGLLFAVSDALLARRLFYKKSLHGNFAVMLTYLAAQACLAAGFMEL